jgi:hypothetical protein
MQRFQHPPSTDHNMISQEEIKKRILPLMEKSGQRFRKKTNVFAKKAEGGEKIETITADGKETVNTADPGDYLVKNQTGAEEMYIVSPEKFGERYVFLHQAEDGFAAYRATGEITALELTAPVLQELELPAPFHFEAPWGEKMIAREGDYLATPPDQSEVYRIARREFLETYDLK